MNPRRNHVLVFGYGLSAIAGIVAVRIFFKTGAGNPFFVLTAVCIFFLSITALRPKRLEGFYRIWMIGAHFIGLVVSSTVLTVVFYLVFGTVGLILRLLNKDLLERKWDGKKNTYWILSAEKTFTADEYKRQF